LVGLTTAVWMARGQLWPVLDGLAAASLAGLAGWHASCVVRDSCLGTPSDLPWAFAQEGSSVTRHPVEIYAALALAAAAVTLVLLKAHMRLAPGVAAGAALVIAAVVRLATEPLRPSIGDGPVGWYVAGILVGMATVAQSIRSRREPAIGRGN
jgi:prolipoprotein diacylglyceryltransferase